MTAPDPSDEYIIIGGARVPIEFVRKHTADLTRFVKYVPVAVRLFELGDPDLDPVAWKARAKLAYAEFGFNALDDMVKVMATSEELVQLLAAAGLWGAKH